MKFKKGISTISVEKVWDEERNFFSVRKKFQTKNKYERERDFYLFFGVQLQFVPHLIDYSDSEKTIWTQYCGVSLNLKYPPKERYIFKNKIRCMTNTLQILYNLHHNDIRWKNIVENDENQLFLIDFEVISTENKERDPEWILRDKPKKI
jgi:hypothetical protein